MSPTPGPSRWPGPGPVAGVERVPPAHLPAVDADPLGQDVEQPLQRERDLRDAEAAHRPARDVVRVDGQRLDVDVRDAVGAAGVAGGPLEHLGADARVRPGVADDAGPHARAAGRPRRSRPCRSSTAGGASGGSAGSRGVTGRRGPAARSRGRAAPHGPGPRDPPCRRTRRRSATCVTRTVRLGQAEDRGDLAAVLPGALALRVDAQSRLPPPRRPGPRAPPRARGRRARCAGSRTCRSRRARRRRAPRRRRRGR